MKVNDLVYHKHRRLRGIGCISKVLKTKVKVNFGLDGEFTYNPSDLVLIDTSKTKTISFEDFKRMSFINSKKLPEYVIVGNEVRKWIGISWVATRVVKEEDLKTLKRVV